MVILGDQLLLLYSTVQINVVVVVVVVRCVSEREREIRQFVIVKNKFMSVFNVSLLLLQ